VQAFADFADSLLGGALLVALSLSLGSVVWGWIVVRPRERDEQDPLLGRCVQLLVASAVALAGLQAIVLVLKALVIAGSFGTVVDSSLLSTLPFRAGAVRTALALMLAAAGMVLARAPRSMTRWWVVAGSAGLVAASGAWLVHGAGRLEDRGLLMTITVIHQATAAVWVGGLAQLAAAWRLARVEPGVHALWPTLLSRFSRLAGTTMVALLLTSLPLVRTYVGSTGGLIGTGYGSLLVAKIVLLAGALVLAVANRNAVRRWLRAGVDTPAFETAPSYVGGEVVLAVSLVFVAATLASQPPAADVTAEQATWREVVRVFTPKWPRLATPSVAAMQTDTSDPLAAVGGERTVAAYSWSNYSHNVAGLLLLGMSLLALLGDRHARGWGRHWPLGFLGLAVFVFLRTSANDGVWPFGPGDLWRTTFGDAEVLQHRLGALLVGAIGLIEWRARARPGSRLAFVFPALAAAGGVLLLTHAHAAFEPKSYYLIQVTHTAMGALAVLLACARLLELRLATPVGRQPAKRRTARC
jgi:putative copper resistance protein D